MPIPMMSETKASKMEMFPKVNKEQLTVVKIAENTRNDIKRRN
jgi:hypothetical protein